jgi:hypothetical protein
MQAQPLRFDDVKIESEELWHHQHLHAMSKHLSEVDMSKPVKARSTTALIRHISLDPETARIQVSQHDTLRSAYKALILDCVCINTEVALSLLDATWTSSRIETDALPATAGCVCAWSGHPANMRVTVFGNGTAEKPGATSFTATIDARWLMFMHAVRVVGNLPGWIKESLKQNQLDSKQVIYHQELVLTEPQKAQRHIYNAAVDLIRFVLAKA